MADALESSTVGKGPQAAPVPRRFSWLSWSSLFFAFIQSVCTAFVALSNVRLLLGAAAFAGAFGVLKFADKLHNDSIRIPMMAFAIAGAAINLLALWQVHRLRARSASAWRQQPLSRDKKRSERLQLILSLLTIALLVAEELAHWHLKGVG